MLSIMLNHVVYTLCTMCMMASSQSDGDANADSAITVNIEPIQLNIVGN